MAKIIEPKQPENSPGWQQEGETFVIIALDKNEALAVRNNCASARSRCRPDTYPTSLLGAAGRVYEALKPVLKGEV